MSRSSSYIPGSCCFPEACCCPGGACWARWPGPQAKVWLTWMQGGSLPLLLGHGVTLHSKLGDSPHLQTQTREQGAGEEGHPASALPDSSPVPREPHSPLRGVLPTSSVCQVPRNEELASVKQHSTEVGHRAITVPLSSLARGLGQLSWFSFPFSCCYITCLVVLVSKPGRPSS